MVFAAATVLLGLAIVASAYWEKDSDYWLNVLTDFGFLLVGLGAGILAINVYFESGKRQTAMRALRNLVQPSLGPAREHIVTCLCSKFGDTKFQELVAAYRKHQCDPERLLAHERSRLEEVVWDERVVLSEHFAAIAKDMDTLLHVIGWSFDDKQLLEDILCCRAESQRFVRVCAVENLKATPSSISKPFLDAFLSCYIADLSIERLSGISASEGSTSEWIVNVTTN